MILDKDKINQILIEFQNILKKYRPNAQELQLINTKISQMTARNIERQYAQRPSSPKQKPVKPLQKSQSPKKWHKIKID
ncbi:MAG: hypothetical protein ACFFE8_05580 [Candidatus Heimdallarchaeota archaeon]